MPAAKSTGRVSTAYHGQVGGGRAAGDDEQADLGHGVEAEAEEQPTGYMCHGLRDRPGDPAEDAVEQAAPVELPLELGLVEVALAHARGRR